MEKSKYGQVTYKAEADALYPAGCTEGNNSGGDCDWCRIYYEGPPRLRHEEAGQMTKGELRRDDAMNKWARRYDELNGAPESNEDR